MEACLGCRYQREYLPLLRYPRGIDTDGLQFTLPRVTIYRAVCERLEAIDRVRDAIECFHKMMSELGGDVSMSGLMTEWASSELCSASLSAIHNPIGQNLPTDVFPLPGATVTRRRLTLSPDHRAAHHF